MGVPGIPPSTTLVVPEITGMTGCTTAVIWEGWAGSWRRWFKSGVSETSGVSPVIGFALGSEGILDVLSTMTGDCRRALGARERVPAAGPKRLFDIVKNGVQDDVTLEIRT